MRDSRSASQILFNLLPQQTADLKGRVWKVDRWLDPVTIAVDGSSVRRRLIAAIDPWRRSGNDAGNYDDVRAGADIEVVCLNTDRGVHVEKFPDIWVCRVCRRVQSGNRKPCKCGQRAWGQFHFVGFHGCGWVGEPWIRRCAAHDDVVMNSPGSSSVRDLVFSCPVCHLELMRGLGAGRPCPGCRGTSPGVSYNVHRAASVYTPHSFTMVNPPRPEQLRELTAAGGAARCLDWVVAGLVEDRPTSAPQSRSVFIENLVGQGLPLAAAEAAAAAAAKSGDFAFAEDAATDMLGLPTDRLDLAREDALDVALAVHNGRRRASHLAGEDPDSPIAELYSSEYLPALRGLGLDDVELVDRFPVLRGVYGYTRGGGAADQHRLVMFRGGRGVRRVYGDAAETEALYFRLDPVSVCTWLHTRGLIGTVPSEPTDARVALLAAMDIPDRGEEVTQDTVGSAVLTMMHSLSHRVIRQLSVLAGIDRESLAEYLVPRHLGFFVYAAPRGDFVLGGLQSVFETDLHTLLHRVITAESRCPLDPGCAHGSGACLACLHLGEPSCTHFNRFLDRGTLFGGAGFLAGA
jgi:hypothetical protein